jgi:hypothetical protein
MLSQSGFAKAKLLNMHTKALIRPFDKGGPRLAKIPALHGRTVRFIRWLP